MWESEGTSRRTWQAASGESNAAGGAAEDGPEGIDGAIGAVVAQALVLLADELGMGQGILRLAHGSLPV